MDGVNDGALNRNNTNNNNEEDYFDDNSEGPPPKPKIGNTIPPPRSGHVCSLIDDYMLIWGGYSEIYNHEQLKLCQYMDPKHLWLYYPDAQKWKKCELVKGPTELSGAQTVYVPSKRTLYLIFGFTFQHFNREVYQLNLDTKEWSNVICNNENIPAPRDKFSAWEFDNKIYVFGGHGPAIHDFLNNGRNNQFVENYSDESLSVIGWNNQLLEFNLSTYMWRDVETFGNIPSPRAAHSMVKTNTFDVYLFGGRLLDTRLNDLYHLNLKTFFWTRIAVDDMSIPCGRSWHTLNVVNFPQSSFHMNSGDGDDGGDGGSGGRDVNQLILVGGYSNDGDVLDDIWTIDIPPTNHATTCNMWRYRGKLTSTPRLWHTTTVTKSGDVLVFGGCITDILNQAISVHTNDLTCMRLYPDTLYRLLLKYIVRNKKLFEDKLHNIPRVSQTFVKKYWNL